MNCFLFIFMITLAVATSNPDDDFSYGEVVNKYNSCKKEKDKCKDTITQIQILISPLTTPGSTTPEPTTPEPTKPVTATPEPTTPEPTTPEPTTPEPTTPEPITSVTTKLSDEDRDTITRLGNKIQILVSKVSDEDKDTITQLENKIQMLISKVSDDGYRIEHCGLISSLADDRITANSIYRNHHHWYGTQHSRLNTRSGDGGWWPHTPYEGSWIELNLGKDEEVAAVATQGSWNYRGYVETYRISYKSSTSSVFSDVKNQYGEKQIFNGNTDWSYTVVINDFTPPLTAQFIRIHPLSWNTAPGLRFDLLSC